MIAITNTSTTVVARVSIRARSRGGASDARKPSRMCSRAPQRDDGAQHRQPQEQDGGELVRPGQRPIEDVARDHARQQHQDFDRDQDGGRDFGQAGEQPVEAGERA